MSGEHKNEHEFHHKRRHREHGSTIDRVQQFHHGRTRHTEHKATENTGIKKTHTS